MATMVRQPREPAAADPQNPAGGSHVRHRQHRLHAGRHQPGHAHDPGAGLLLRRSRRAPQRAVHHDPELRLHGRDHHPLVLGGLLALLLGRRRRDHRQPGPGLPARHRSDHAVRRRADPHAGLRGLPDDVRHHHAGPDHRRLQQPGAFPGLPDLPGAVAAAGLLPVRAHDLGRRPAGQVGRARLRRRHCRAQHRRHGRPGLGPVRGQAPCQGGGAALHPAGGPGHRPALVRLVRLQRRQRTAGGPVSPRWPSSTPTSPPASPPSPGWSSSGAGCASRGSWAC